MPDKGVVFISCGQVTDDEKQLGAAISKLVGDLTPFEPYFAEYQSSLEGLSKNILGALDKSIGLIAVLHPRGTVRFPNGSEHTRASVWVEQEIAVAAYLTQVAGRKLNLAAYAHKSVKREGMRDQLLLNPQIFATNDEVLAHLSGVLPRWVVSPSEQKSHVEIRFERKNLMITQKRHDYRLEVTLVNRGAETIDKYYLEVLFPSDFLTEDSVHWVEVKERRTPTHRFFRMTQEHQKRSLFPGDPVMFFTLDYFVDEDLFAERNGHFNDIVTATIFVPGRQPEKAEIGMQELQNF